MQDVLDNVTYIFLSADIAYKDPSEGRQFLFYGICCVLSYKTIIT